MTAVRHQLAEEGDALEALECVTFCFGRVQRSGIDLQFHEIAQICPFSLLWYDILFKANGVSKLLQKEATHIDLHETHVGALVTWLEGYSKYGLTHNGRHPNSTVRYV